MARAPHPPLRHVDRSHPPAPPDAHPHLGRRETPDCLPDHRGYDEAPGGAADAAGGGGELGDADVCPPSRAACAVGG
eukprot:scaffold11123_cov68-Isochrysis_galbana.AAC.1